MFNIKEETYPNLGSICRLCLAENAQVNIFSSISTNLSVPMRIMACLAIEVQTKDDLPKNICNECRYKLEKSYYFRKQSQASDNKLRKHIRLLSMGKMSKLFMNKSDDEFLDEIEYEDSIRFIENEDLARQQTMEQEWKEKYRKEMLQETTEFTEKFRNELKQELRSELRKELWDEIKDELRTEVEIELKQTLRSECIEQAKTELRKDVFEECRELEVNNLLNDLESYLKEKRKNTPTILVQNIDGNTAKEERKLYKLSSPILLRTKRLKRKYQETIEGNGLTIDNTNQVTNTNDSKNSEPYDILSMTSETSPQDNGFENDDEMNGDDPNLFIFETEREQRKSIDMDNDVDADNDNQEPLVDDDDSYYTPQIDNFNVNSCESNTNRDTTSYQIDINGMRFYKKNITNNEGEKKHEAECLNDDENVVVFNVEDVEDNYTYDTNELVDIENKKTHNKNLKPNRTSTRTNKSIIMECNSQLTDNEYVDDNTKPSYAIVRSTDTAKTFQCKQCPSLFSTEYSLNRHLKTHKRMEVDGIGYQCSQCKIFVSCRSALTRHMIIHTGEKPFKCELCPKSFGQREILKRHLQIHTGEKPFKCEQCDRAFSQRINLTMHIKKHHSSEAKVQLFSCHLCPKRFHHASGLSRHLVSHNGVQYQCSKCERTFGDRSSVKRHIANIHGETNIDVQKVEECITD